MRLLFSYLACVITIGTVTGSPLTYIHGPQPDLLDEQSIIEENALDREVSPHDVIYHDDRDASRHADNKAEYTREWTFIYKGGPTVFTAPERFRFVTECQASGSPSPQIYWLRGEDPQKQLNELIGNSVADVKSSPGTIAKVSSKLVIDCVSPSDVGNIYCASVSGSKTAISSPLVFRVIENTTGRNHSGCGAESQPTVTMFAPTMLAFIGSRVVLPCRASGRPRPHTYWLDINGKLVNPSENPRFKALSSGELVIDPLRWEDMGGYSCVARSGRLEDSVTTFLYPVLNTNEHS
ncbi:neural/ectodermal development factor IMP-L2 [Orussus abietinus]|uniref:neural/ectodermal development factor IMP-L2 n=1 Tax=Orussus abietinus TaxID=222816 RepID=UPI00062550CB|nr:neural/ectodermal development factor IMP-L2 [Orussus abietinus]